MALSTNLRTRLQAIVEGNYTGFGTTVPVGMFHKVAHDRTWDTADLGSIERAYATVISTRQQLQPLNQANGFGYFKYPFIVQVGYLRTLNGDDFDGSGQQDGAGTDNAIEDRISEDQHILEAAIGDFRNWAGIDPGIIDLYPTTTGVIDYRPDRVILPVTFEWWTRIALPGAYGPTL